MNEIEELNRKLDVLLELAPTIKALGKLLVRSHTAARRMELNKNTLSQSKHLQRFEEVGHRRTYVEVGELAVVKKRRKR